MWVRGCTYLSWPCIVGDGGGGRLRSGCGCVVIGVVIVVAVVVVVLVVVGLVVVVVAVGLFFVLLPKFGPTRNRDEFCVLMSRQRYGTYVF